MCIRDSGSAARRGAALLGRRERLRDLSTLLGWRVEARIHFWRPDARAAAALREAPGHAQPAASHRPSGWSTARSISASAMASLRLGNDARHGRRKINSAREDWAGRLQALGLDDQVGIKFLGCPDR
eukprot:922162-Alexandrium_andersonii.AAC.1